MCIYLYVYILYDETNLGLFEGKIFENQVTVGVERKVTDYWDMLPIELHVVILKMHHQETMLFRTRKQTVSGWQQETTLCV